MLGAYATNQAMIQRYLSLPTLKDARRFVLLHYVVFFNFQTQVKSD